ncbi:energy transducer TonB [Brevundimonas sp. SORGH_AS_0993]|uniref:energy transducer TonB n=1 Tax=Brevundimonas sp. SORGH_AS_0993 TaxID=3041794 RepID=UPI002785174A|nr:energy transducer TonB [Brevundimonas sp. SORGH_AS_0993]MDQ1154616.1 protein TonB [Brevundimonas sp. SORGH_AS_0993]
MAFDGLDPRPPVLVRSVSPARARGRRWIVGLGLSAMAHGLPLLVFAGYWASRPPPAPPPAPVFEVELVRFQAPPQPPSEQPPGPEQTEAKARPPIPRPPVTPHLAAPPPPDVEPLTVPPPVPRVEPASPRPPAPETTAPPSRPAPPARLPSSSPSWEGRLLAHLERRKRYPAEARAARQEGVASVRFTMDRRGRVLSVVLAQSSGHAALDREAVALIQRAQPLPVPPDSVPGDPLVLTVPVEFFVRRR